MLTGTGTAFKVGFLREVQQARRDYRLPDLGHTGGVYDTSALTEDNELTICAKELGYRVVSPKDCTGQDGDDADPGQLVQTAPVYSSAARWRT